MNCPNCTALGVNGLYCVLFGLALPPLAHVGLEYTVSSVVMPRLRRPVTIWSARWKLYAGSAGSVGLTGWVGAISDHKRSTRVNLAPVALTLSSRPSMATVVAAVVSWSSGTPAT